MPVGSCVRLSVYWHRKCDILGYLTLLIAELERNIVPLHFRLLISKKDKHIENYLSSKGVSSGLACQRGDHRFL